MSIQELSKIDKKIKHWYIPMAIGVLAIVLGIWIFFTSEDSLISLNIVFAIAFIIMGFLQIIFALINKKTKYWIAIIIFGVINLIFGIILLILPNLTISVLALMLGFAIIIHAINLIKTSLNLKKYDKSSWLLSFIIGIIGIILSLALFYLVFFVNFSEIKISRTLIIAVSLVVMGTLNILYSFKLKGFHK